MTKDYRGDSLAFLYSVMKGRTKEREAIIDKSTAEVRVIKKPVTIEGRMKAAERILKYYTDKNNISESEGTGIIILPREEISEDINQSTHGC